MPLRWLSTLSHVSKPPANQRMELAARAPHGSAVGPAPPNRRVQLAGVAQVFVMLTVQQTQEENHA